MLSLTFNIDDDNLTYYDTSVISYSEDDTTIDEYGVASGWTTTGITYDNTQDFESTIEFYMKFTTGDDVETNPGTLVSNTETFTFKIEQNTTAYLNLLLGDGSWYQNPLYFTDIEPNTTYWIYYYYCASETIYTNYIETGYVSDTISSVSVYADKFAKGVDSTEGEYTFTCSVTEETDEDTEETTTTTIWYLNDEEIKLSHYGITVTDDPSDGDTITVTYSITSEDLPRTVFKYSLDGENYITIADATDYDTHLDPTAFQIGCIYESTSSYTNNDWTGTIDLSEFTLILDGETVIEKQHTSAEDCILVKVDE